jgi:hypothetical protein
MNQPYSDNPQKQTPNEYAGKLAKYKETGNYNCIVWKSEGLFRNPDSGIHLLDIYFKDN